MDSVRISITWCACSFRNYEPGGRRFNADWVATTSAARPDPGRATRNGRRRDAIETFGEVRSLLARGSRTYTAFSGYRQVTQLSCDPCVTHGVSKGESPSSS